MIRHDKDEEGILEVILCEHCQLERGFQALKDSGEEK